MSTHRFPAPPPTLPDLPPGVRALVECDNATLQQAILYLEVKRTLLKLEEDNAERFSPERFNAMTAVGMIEIRLAALRLMEAVTSTYAWTAVNGATSVDAAKPR